MLRFFFFLLIVLCACTVANSQESDWKLDIIETSILVLSDTSYQKKVRIKGKNLTGTIKYYPVRNGDLESVTNLSAYYLIDKGSKKIKEKDFIRSSLSQVFKSDVTIIGVPVEPFSSFFIEVEYVGYETMLVARVQLQQDNTDTVKTSIELPQNWILNKRTTDLAPSNHQEEVTEDGGTIHRFISTTKNSRSLSLPIIVHPAQYESEDYFSLWYQEHLNTMELLPDNIIDQITAVPPSDTLNWIRSVYETVQGKITYVDMEEALGAFIPRPPEFTWNNKYGDCKDMSFLIHSILRSKGLKSHIAISRSLSLSEPFDFPSLTLADHVICILDFHGDTFYLDATDKNCSFGNPSSHTQDCEIFIIDGKESKFDRVRKMEPAENVDSTYLFVSLLHPDSSSFYRRMNGKSAKPFLEALYYSKIQELEHYFEDLHSLDHFGLQFSTDTHSFIVNGKTNLAPSQITTFGKKTLIPYTILFPLIDMDLDTAMKYQPIYRTYRTIQYTEIEFLNDISEVHYDWKYTSDPGFDFSHEIAVVGNRVKIKEMFELNSVSLDQPQIIALQRFIDEFELRKKQLLTFQMK